MRQTVGEAHHHTGAFLGKAEQPHFVAADRHGQRYAGEDRQVWIWLAVFAQDLDISGQAWPEVIAHARVGRGISDADHPAKPWQVVLARQFRELPLYAAADHIFHLMAIWLPERATAVTRSPLLIVAPGRKPGRAATLALWLPW
ncbi:hypothetical protein D3C79_933700 [compost metagenome]